jgi:hypothetical protein
MPSQTLQALNRFLSLGRHATIIEPTEMTLTRGLHEAGCGLQWIASAVLSSRRLKESQ